MRAGVVTELRVRLQPRGGLDEVVGERDGAIVVRVSAPPVDGRANEALCAFMAGRAGVSKRSVRIVAGERSRDKIVRVEGVDLAQLRRALGLT